MSLLPYSLTYVRILLSLLLVIQATVLQYHTLQY